jgi:predicted RNA methylase
LRVLELGCGDGRLTFQLAPAARSLVAVDPDETRLTAARAALPAELADKVELVVAGATEVRSPAPSSTWRSSPGRCDESKKRAS